jgi:DNA replication protein DnaC
MANDLLNSLLKEYEQKKLKAELDLEKRRQELYLSIPKLQQIEDELNNFAILTARNILLHNNSSLEELNQKAENLKQQKSHILQEAKLPSNYLTPNYECSICKDTGYISTNNYKTEMCNCLKQKLLDVSFNKSNMTNLDKENFEAFNENLFSDEIDLVKYHFNISPRQNIKNIKQKCVEFVENFDNPNTKNLLFTGNTGLR